MFPVKFRDGRWLPEVFKAWLLAALGFWLPMAGMAADKPAQLRFDTPDQAVAALMQASRGNQTQELLKIFGPAGRKLVFSGDAVADKRGREKFVAAFELAHRLESQGEGRAVLLVGEKEWPLPIPLVKVGQSWHFDTLSGVDEILSRRIGRNELSAMEVCRAYVDAQRDYAMLQPRSAGPAEYAQHFMSRPGKRDGLYWPVAAGEAASPMGCLVASARAEGYAAAKGEKHVPYHGYYYRILKRQGAAAADGPRDYRVDGRMVGGFALLAFPARHGESGIMSFIVNQDGVVYQKNLGRATASLARQMTEFNPDPSWSKLAEPAR